MDLCFLSGNSIMVFAAGQYEQWLKTSHFLKNMAKIVWFMFYWEEKMGNWAAKS
jgi:hypothetical protein